MQLSSTLSRCRLLRPRAARAMTQMAGRTYAEAVHDLNRLQTNHQIIEQIKASGGRLNALSIPEFAAFVEKLGHTVAQLNTLNIIHVAGTKGKGSTCAFVNAILQQRNLKVGLYTSPHLIEARERIQINSQPLTQQSFAQYFYEVYDALRAPDPPLRKVSELSPAMPMYFRFLTLMAFHTFLREKVDVAVIEVGVGGQYDSTNVITRPVVCGIASLGLDHQSSLGQTLGEIAWHKAGIIKPQVPVFSVPQPDDAMQVIRDRAQENHAELEVVDPLPSDTELGIPGSHQRTNAALAAALCRAWGQRQGVAIDDQLVARGLAEAHWPGRSQTFASPRIPDLTWHVDGAHTTESIQACALWFRSAISRDTPCVLLFNAAHDRSAQALLETLAEVLSPVRFVEAVFCPNINHTRADSANFTVAFDKDLAPQHAAAQAWNALTNCPTTVLPSIDAAVAHIESIHPNAHALATGSLHLVGGVLDQAKGSI